MIEPRLKHITVDADGWAVVMDTATQVVQRARVTLFPGGSNSFEALLIKHIVSGKEALASSTDVMKHGGNIKILNGLVTKAAETWPGDATLIKVQQWCEQAGSEASASEVFGAFAAALEACQTAGVIDPAAVMALSQNKAFDTVLIDCTSKEADMLDRFVKECLTKYEERAATTTKDMLAITSWCVNHVRGEKENVKDMVILTNLCKNCLALETAIETYKAAIPADEVVATDPQWELLKGVLGAKAGMEAACAVATTSSSAKAVPNVFTPTDEGDRWLLRIRHAVIAKHVATFKATLDELLPKAQGGQNGESWHAALDETTASITDALDLAYIEGGLLSLPNYEVVVDELKTLEAVAQQVLGIWGTTLDDATTEKHALVREQLLITRCEQLLLALFGVDGMASTRASEREASTRAARAMIGGARKFKKIFRPVYERALLALKSK